MWDWIQDVFAGEGGAAPDSGGAVYDIPNAEIGGDIWNRLPGIVGDIYSDSPRQSGGGGGGGGMMPVALPAMGAIGGMAVAAGRTLASLFARAGAAATLNINGVRGTIPQLWKYTRRYGPQAVATALGISIGTLGTYLLSAPDAGRRRRARGISGRDIRTTKRVVGFVSRMASQIGCVRAPRHFRRGFKKRN